MLTKLNSSFNVFQSENIQLCSIMRILFNVSFCCNHNCNDLKKL